MKRNVTVSALSGALASLGLIAAPAHADFFVGGTVGQSDIGSYEFGGDTVLKNDDSDTAFHVFVGWRPLEYLAVTVGYADLGELSVAGRYDDGGEGGGNIGYTDDIEATAIDVSVLGILPFSMLFGDEGFLSRISVFAQLGVARADQDITYREGTGEWNGSDDSTNVVYGVGVNVNVTDNLGVHARYWDYGDIGDRNSNSSGHEQDWAAWGAGVTWSFGDGN